MIETQKTVGSDYLACLGKVLTECETSLQHNEPFQHNYVRPTFNDKHIFCLPSIPDYDCDRKASYATIP